MAHRLGRHCRPAAPSRRWPSRRRQQHLRRRRSSCRPRRRSPRRRIGTRSPSVGVFLPPPLKTPQPLSATSAGDREPTPDTSSSLRFLVCLSRLGRRRRRPVRPPSEPRVDGSMSGTSSSARSGRTACPPDRACSCADRRSRPVRPRCRTTDCPCTASGLQPVDRRPAGLQRVEFGRWSGGSARDRGTAAPSEVSPAIAPNLAAAPFRSFFCSSDVGLGEQRQRAIAVDVRRRRARRAACGRRRRCSRRPDRQTRPASCSPCVAAAFGLVMLPIAASRRTRRAPSTIADRRPPAIARPDAGAADRGAVPHRLRAGMLHRCSAGRPRQCSGSGREWEWRGP